VHHRADAGASVVAAAGIGGAMAGYPFMDPLAGGLVARERARERERESARGGGGRERVEREREGERERERKIYLGRDVRERMSERARER
jgi:hypothetical protein